MSLKRRPYWGIPLAAIVGMFTGYEFLQFARTYKQSEFMAEKNKIVTFKRANDSSKVISVTDTRDLKKWDRYNSLKRYGDNYDAVLAQNASDTLDALKKGTPLAEFLGDSALVISRGDLGYVYIQSPMTFKTDTLRIK